MKLRQKRQALHCLLLVNIRQLVVSTMGMQLQLLNNACQLFFAEYLHSHISECFKWSECNLVIECFGYRNRLILLTSLQEAVNFSTWGIQLLTEKIPMWAVIKLRPFNRVWLTCKDLDLDIMYFICFIDIILLTN